MVSVEGGFESFSVHGGLASALSSFLLSAVAFLGFHGPLSFAVAKP